MEYGILALIIAGGAIAWNAVSSMLHAKERTILLNRVMSKNYEEFKYYEEKYPEDIEEVKKMRTEDREERGLSKEEPLDETKAKEFEQHLEEDWSPEELDMEKVKKELENES